MPGNLTLAQLDEAIAAGDVDTVRRHYLFMDEVLRAADDDVWNAVAVSYLEDLDFRGPSGAAIARRPSQPHSEAPPTADTNSRRVKFGRIVIFRLGWHAHSAAVGVVNSRNRHAHRCALGVPP